VPFGDVTGERSIASAIAFGEADRSAQDKAAVSVAVRRDEETILQKTGKIGRGAPAADQRVA
jgi:hypothetical protein